MLIYPYYALNILEEFMRLQSCVSCDCLFSGVKIGNFNLNDEPACWGCIQWNADPDSYRDADLAD
jgi:hypothetical protein